MRDLSKLPEGFYLNMSNNMRHSIKTGGNKTKKRKE